MKIITTTVLALSFALALAGCNTMRGFGQDVQKVGDKVEEAASRKK
jgi:predicted small secreted protein